MSKLHWALKNTLCSLAYLKSSGNFGNVFISLMETHSQSQWVVDDKFIPSFLQNNAANMLLCVKFSLQ